MAASGKDVVTSAIGIDIGDLPPLPCNLSRGVNQPFREPELRHSRSLRPPPRPSRGALLPRGAAP